MASSAPTPPYQSSRARVIRTVSQKQLTRTITEVNMAIKIAQQNPTSQIAQWKSETFRVELNEILDMHPGPEQLRRANRLQESAARFIQLIRRPT